VFQRRGLIDAVKAIGSRRPVVAKDAAGWRTGPPIGYIGD
jgi:hypothetical protein